MKGWIGVDLDGTLAKYDGWRGEDHIGEPIPAMAERVKAWLADGKEVRIMTARASMTGRDVERQRMNAVLIKAWCKEHLGQELEVTSDKDWGMVALYDDRAYRVVENKGQLVEELMNNIDHENIVRASELEAENAKLRAEREELRELLWWVEAKLHPELNVSNYDHGQVCELNANATEAVLAIRAALAEKV